MKNSAHFNLVPLTTILMGVLLLGITLCFASMNFAFYINSLNRDTKTMLNAMEDSLKRAPLSHHAEQYATIVAPHLFRRSLVMSLSDSEHRVTILFHSLKETKTAPTIILGLRQDPPARPSATHPSDRFIVGLANLFGLESARSHWGSIVLDVRANELLLAPEVQLSAPTYIAMLACALALAWIIGGILSRQALKPLLEVTAALERLSSDSLALEFVPAQRGEALARLTRAYNAAVEKVQAAFAERDRSHTAMRQFITDAGHQLRTPLTVIRGFITLLAENKPIAPHERDHCLAVMLNQSLLMGILIDNLILLDRWEQPYDTQTTNPVDILQFLDDVIEAHRETNPTRDIRFINRSKGPMLARIEPQEFHYAIANLLDNALKYTEGLIEVIVSDYEDAMSITLRDEGPGMPQSVANHAFDRFCRGNRRDIEGSGLGLSIAKRAIERAQGSLTVESQEIGGSVFTIQLPRTEIAEMS